ncbi:hypothetical protein GCM10029992_11720 [Glycomyces albus]
MAAMYATIANDGEYMPTHFVAEVHDRNGEPVQPLEGQQIEGEQVIAVETARDLQWVGSEIGGETETDTLPRDYFGKTGTWEAAGYEASCRNDPDTTDVEEQCQKYPDSYNAHAWYVGAIPQLSIAAWVGNLTTESDPIFDPNGDPTSVFGSNTAYPVWFQAMSTILDKKEDDEGWEQQEWQGKSLNGSLNTWDIENADGTIDPDSKYCQENGDDPKCGTSEEDEDEEENCEGPGNGGGNGQECDDEGGGETPTTDPTDDPTGPTDDLDCDGWIPDPGCEDQEPTEEPTTPEENSTTEDPGNRD